MLQMITHPPPTIERPPSINDFCGSSESYTAMYCIALLLNWVLCGQSFQYVLVYNFTNTHAMSHRSDFFASAGSRGNIQEPAVCFTLQWLSSVFKSDYPAFQFLPPCRIQNLWTPHCSRLKSLPKMHVSSFLIWATLLFKSLSMLGGHQWMWARSGLLVGILLDMRLRGNSICTADSRTPAAVAS